METGRDDGVYNSMEDLVAGYEIIYKDTLSIDPENPENKMGKLDFVVASSSEIENDGSFIEV